MMKFVRSAPLVVSLLLLPGLLLVGLGAGVLFAPEVARVAGAFALIIIGSVLLGLALGAWRLGNLFRQAQIIVSAPFAHRSAPRGQVVEVTEDKIMMH